MSEQSPLPLAWITGSGGLIGHYLLQFAPPGVRSAFRLRGLARSDLDLRDASAMRRLFQREKPSLIIHCAAMSKSPACQADPSGAQQVNVDATARLADLARDITFIFLSTDLVFDGRRGNYVETDATNPLSIYAETKVKAENMVLTHPSHIVVRTSLNGGKSPSGDRGFNEEMCHAWRAGKVVNLFTDEFRCPIPARVTAEALWNIALVRPAGGIYHLGGSEKLSRWQIGQLVAARHPDLHPQLRAGSLREYQGAPRPPDTSLCSAKLQGLLSFPLPGLTDWLHANPDEPF